jgi:hypothetical protein
VSAGGGDANAVLIGDPAHGEGFFVVAGAIIQTGQKMAVNVNQWNHRLDPRYELGVNLQTGSLQ